MQKGCEPSWDPSKSSESAWKIAQESGGSARDTPNRGSKKRASPHDSPHTAPKFVARIEKSNTFTTPSPFKSPLV